MKKIFTICLFLFAISFFASPVLAIKKQPTLTPTPSPSPAVEATMSLDVVNFNSFAEFWPVTAGKVMGEPLYFLKILKEDLRGLLYFSDLRKADYNMTLSEKRLVEAEKLYKEKKDNENGQKSLVLAQEKREKALSLLEKSKESGRNTTDLLNRLKSSFKRQRTLLQNMENLVQSSAKGQIANSLKSLESLLIKLES